MTDKEFYNMLIENEGSITEDRVIICPYCFFEDDDLANIDAGSKVVKCVSCHKSFKLDVDISVDCTTYPLEVK